MYLKKAHATDKNVMTIAFVSHIRIFLLLKSHQELIFELILAFLIFSTIMLVQLTSIQEIIIDEGHTYSNSQSQTYTVSE
jgi:hypothetical protein